MLAGRVRLVKFSPNITAEVHMLATDEGGRQGPTPPDMFGCPVGIAGEFFDMRMDLSSVGALPPGASAQVPIRFLRPDLVMPLLHPGEVFTLWEGKTVGTGKVVQIHEI
jgi:hypothetical protein